MNFGTQIPTSLRMSCNNLSDFYYFGLWRITFKTNYIPIKAQV